MEIPFKMTEAGMKKPLVFWEHLLKKKIIQFAVQDSRRYLSPMRDETFIILKK
jgi:hypothetical protein